jgi:hypothetical protein
MGAQCAEEVHLITGQEQRTGADAPRCSCRLSPVVAFSRTGRPIGQQVRRDQLCPNLGATTECRLG